MKEGKQDMKFERIKLADLPMIYVTTELRLRGRRYLACASEARDARALIIDPETKECADLWLGETGCMNIVQIPGQERLLAIIRFYPVFDSREAAVCLLEPGEGGIMAPWRMREVVRLPFCHRIGVVQSENGLFLLACQLCADKDCTEDWSKPGALWTCPIPEDGGEWRLTRVYDGLFRNHGLFIEHGNQVTVCAEQGVLHFDLSAYAAGQPLVPDGGWETPTSDICIYEGGGERLAATIEPFHGNLGAVYSLGADAPRRLGAYGIAFGHAVWVGKLCGRKAMILGSRAGERKALEVVLWETGERLTIEENAGPTQIAVYEDGGQSFIFSANHEPGEAVLYRMESL